VRDTKQKLARQVEDLEDVRYVMAVLKEVRALPVAARRPLSLPGPRRIAWPRPRTGAGCLEACHMLGSYQLHGICQVRLHGGAQAACQHGACCMRALWTSHAAARGAAWGPGA